MASRRNNKLAHIILATSVVFLIVSGICLYYGSNFITRQLLLANQYHAGDLALIVENNFKITDAEVAHMKSLTFNQMEVDPINMRLMNIGNDVPLNASVSNVYIVAALQPEEIKYSTTEEMAKFFGYPVGTKLNGVWLLNGRIEEGKFQPAQRENIYRYTKLTPTQEMGMKLQKSCGEYSKDAWGEFITGYAPVYTVEGNFVGLLGLDIAPDKFQISAQGMIFNLLGAFLIIAITLTGLFLYFYLKYVKMKDSELYFDFYSRMSHDLRTPMNGILGMAELSRDEQNMAMLHSNFRKVEESGRYMLALINESLDLQRIDSEMLRLNPEQVVLKDLISHINDMVSLQATKMQVQYEMRSSVDLNVTVRVDELRLKQILTNILFNAVKFTPEQGRVTLYIEGAGKGALGERYIFRVVDTGIGMKEEFVTHKLFQPFEQEEHEANQYGGSGLGMAIVHKLITLMGGTIKVVSQQGKGTTFAIHLELPLVTGDKDNAATQQEYDLGVLAGKEILLCEDHPLNIEITKRMLEKVGCIVTVACNGREGVDIFKAEPENKFAVILMDMRMPLLNGLEATQEIRNLGSAYSAKIPIIAVTANAYDEDIKRAMAMGMTDYLTKPINSQNLYEAILRQL